MITPPSPRSALRALLVIVAAVVVWFGAQGFNVQWQNPPTYSVDALETLTRFKAAEEHGASFLVRPEVQRLGAPWVADWRAYPLPDGPWYWLIGKLAATFGLIPASYLALMLAHVLATASFYACARFLRQPVPIALGCALLFGFCFSIFERGLSHHSFALAFAVPPAILASWLIGGSRTALERGSGLVACFGAAVIVGVGNPYFIFFHFQLLGLALLHQWFGPRRRTNLRIGFACGAVTAAVFVAANLPALMAMLTTESGTFSRNYAASELYALKPIELLVPPTNHRWVAAAELGRLYDSSTWLRGELFSPYLGMVGAAGLLLVLGRTVRQLFRGRASLRPAHGPQVLWIFAFAVVGGINGMLALAGFDLFRAVNRYSIHVLALSLFALGAFCTRKARPVATFAVWALATGAVAFGLWDQVPRQQHRVHWEAMHRLVGEDRAAAAALESKYPQGAMFFQLPTAPFPEAGPRNEMTDYEHLRLYLHSDTLRFSYGAMAHSPQYRWNAWIAAQPVDAMIAALERAGFAAVIIDRRGYADAARMLQDQMRSFGKTPVAIPGAPHLIQVPLQPASKPELPDVTEVRLHEAWSGIAAANTSLSVHAVSGWHQAERGAGEEATWRWSANDARLGLWNEGPAGPVRVSFSATAVEAGTLAIRHEGAELWSGEITNEVKLVDFLLELPAGSTELDFEFQGRTVRVHRDPRRLGFQIEEPKLARQQ